MDAKTMTFEQLIFKIENTKNCAVDCKHLFCSNIHDFAKAQQEWYNNNKPITKPTRDAITRKKMLQEIYKSLQVKKNIKPLNSRLKRHTSPI